MLLQQESRGLGEREGRGDSGKWKGDNGRRQAPDETKFRLAPL